MRKSAVLSFCLIIIFLHTGVYFGFYFLRKQIRTEIKQRIKEGLSDSETTTLVFNSEEFQQIQWVDKKEIKLNGKLFDIIRISKKDNNYCLQVINDKQEEKLFADLNRLTEHELHGSKEKNKLNQLGKFFELKFLFEDEKSFETPVYLSESYYPQKTNNPLKGHHAIPGEPPDFFI